MKKLATECLIPFEISLIGSSVENIYQLLTLSPEKFEEITSTMLIPVNKFMNDIYPTSDWAFVKVMQDKFPNKKLNCAVIKNFSNKDDCIKAVIDSLARKMLNGPLYIPFKTLDEQHLKSDSLSQRKYATLLNCARPALKAPIREPKIQINDSKVQEYDEPLF